MTAKQVIEEIQSLPPDEKAKVVDFVQQLNESQKIDSKKLDASADRVFDRYDGLFKKLAK
jgi:hypothetical protein